MAATLLRSVRATKCLQAVARNVFPRVSSVSVIHCRQENKQMHSCTNSARMLAPRNGTCQLLHRYYSEKQMAVDEIMERVLNVCQQYDKINAEKLQFTSHFMNDLGLDSLDHVEVIMAIEDEFQFEIPDQDAERLMTPEAIVQYVCDKEDVYDE